MVQNIFINNIEFDMPVCRGIKGPDRECISTSFINDSASFKKNLVKLSGLRSTDTNFCFLCNWKFIKKILIIYNNELSINFNFKSKYKLTDWFFGLKRDLGQGNLNFFLDFGNLSGILWSSGIGSQISWSMSLKQTLLPILLNFSCNILVIIFIVKLTDLNLSETGKWIYLRLYQP